MAFCGEPLRCTFKIKEQNTIWLTCAKHSKRAWQEAFPRMALFQRCQRLLPGEPPDEEKVEQMQRGKVRENTKVKERVQKETKAKVKRGNPSR